MKPARGFLPDTILQAVLLLFFVTMIAQPFVVPTCSMENTVMTGDHIIVDKLAYAPDGGPGSGLLPHQPIQRGDIVAFRYPIDPRETYVKRVIGVPGDRLRIIDKQLYLNGHAPNEPYKVHSTSFLVPYRDSFPAPPPAGVFEPALSMLRDHVVNGELAVPPGHYFVMGDNRDNSEDSRYWGFVPRANIIGKPVIVWWSYDAPTERLRDPSLVNPDHLLDLALHFFSKTRWERTFKLVRGYPLE